MARKHGGGEQPVGLVLILAAFLHWLDALGHQFVLEGDVFQVFADVARGRARPFAHILSPLSIALRARPACYVAR